jgi:starch-binding outer membrane protein, SusD/RagB family
MVQLRTNTHLPLYNQPQLLGDRTMNTIKKHFTTLFHTQTLKSLVGNNTVQAKACVSKVALVLGAASLAGSLSFGLNGCTIDSKINVSPNSVSANSIESPAGLSAVLVGSQTMTAEMYTTGRARLGSLWTWQTVISEQRSSRSQYFVWNTYDQSPTGANADVWAAGYNAVKLCNDVLAAAPKVFGSQPALLNTYLGIANTLKAFNLAEIAACYGSAPIAISLTNPADPAPYVTQVQVYAEALRLLGEAQRNFDAVTAAPAGFNQDLNFKGNPAKWRAIVSSLRARYLLHTKDYAGALAAANSGVTSAADGLFAFYGTLDVEQSPWSFWLSREPNNPFCPDKSYVDAIKSEAGDKRIERLAPGPMSTTNEVIGFALRQRYPTTRTDVTADERNGFKAAIIRLYAAPSEKFPMISADEVTLIKAEAAARTNAAATALQSVNAIRTAAGLTALAATDARAVNTGGTGGLTPLVREVLKQKYLQLFLEGQSYHDMRRTGTLPDAPGRVPQRFVYPLTEVNNNPNAPADSPDLNTVLRP